MEIDHNRWYINGNRGCVATNAGLADGYFPQGSLRWDVPERGMREDRYRKIKVSSVPFLYFSLSPPELAWRCNRNTEISHFNFNYPYIRKITIYACVDPTFIRVEQLLHWRETKVVGRSSRQDNRGDEQICRSLSRFLQIRLRRLDFEESYTAESNILGSIEFSEGTTAEGSKDIARRIGRWKRFEIGQVG